MTARYVVIGHPVGHSLSPRIHAAFAAATGQSLRYETLDAPVGGFAEAAAAFFSAGGAGANVTVPFKAAAAAWVTELDPAARDAGAVNTITRSGAGFRGYNTDGAGLVRDLTVNRGIALRGARLLLLGAGGAARGALRPLLDERPCALVIANRTVARARALAAAVRESAPRAPVTAAALNAVDGAFDVVINATSAGLGGAASGAAGVPPVPEPAVRGAFCYDMIYGPPGTNGRTSFCRWALDAGAAQVSDGLGMLVEQAALAFMLWRGVAPPARAVLERLRAGDV